MGGAKIHAGQSALRMTLRTFCNLDRAARVSIRFRKPRGKLGEWAALVEEEAEGEISRELEAGDLDEPGWWSFWARVVFRDGREGIGEAARLHVWGEGGDNLRHKDIDERYWDSTRGQRKALQEFAKSEIEWAGILMKWYGRKKAEMPGDEYRACAFFANREFARKPGSLTLCLQAREKCDREFPRFEKEFAFDFLRYRFKAYAQALKDGGHDG